MSLKKLPISYEQDSQFSEAVLTVLRHKSDALSQDAKTALVSLATTPCQLGKPDTQAGIKALLNLHPVLTRSVAPNNMQALCLLPVCLWVAEESGKPSCNIRARLLDWKAQLRTVEGSELDLCLRALNITYALRNEFTETDLRSLASFWQDENRDVLWNEPENHVQDKLTTWCHAIMRLGFFHEHLARSGVKELAQGKPAWHLRWNRSLAEAVSSMTTDKQIHCIKCWSTSPLSPVYALRASRHATAWAWLSSDVQALLTPLLPKNESSRWPMLPWAYLDPSEDQVAYLRETNQAITRAYCPLASRILDMVTTEEMWDDRKSIGACMAKFAKNAPAVDQMDNAGALFDMT